MFATKASINTKGTLIRQAHLLNPLLLVVNHRSYRQITWLILLFKYSHVFYRWEFSLVREVFTRVMNIQIHRFLWTYTIYRDSQIIHRRIQLVELPILVLGYDKTFGTILNLEPALPESETDVIHEDTPWRWCSYYMGTLNSCHALWITVHD